MLHHELLLVLSLLFAIGGSPASTMHPRGVPGASAP